MYEYLSIDVNEILNGNLQVTHIWITGVTEDIYMCVIRTDG